jgi:hypothetical protein
MKHPELYLNKDLEYLIPNGSKAPLFINDTAPPPNNTSPITSSSSPTATASVNATCWEILTLRLGRYARKNVEQNGPTSLTDAMLQSEARRIIYNEDDPWHQTAADNPEWLNLFKQAHGIHNSAAHLAVNSSHHEIMEDLGVRPDAMLDPSFDLGNFYGCKGIDSQDAAVRALAFESSLSGTLGMSQMGQWVGSSSSAAMVAGIPASGHAEPDNVPVSSSLVDTQRLNEPISGEGAGGFFIGDNGEFSLAAGEGGDASKLLALQPTLDDFAFEVEGWDQMDAGFGLAPTSAAATSSGIPANLGLGEFSAAAWDDSELTFDMDMDMDMGQL